MTLDEIELERRKPVWFAFSDLFLDTEINEFEIASIVRICRESKYSQAELQRILLNEVAPVVGLNLLNIFPGGNWSGFDEEWLHSEIIKLEQPFWVIKVPLLKQLYEGVIKSMLRSEWRQILSGLNNMDTDG